MRRKSMWFKLLLAALCMGALVLGGCAGDDGSSGKSAFQIAQDNGFTGTQDEWLDSLGSASAANVEPESCVICHSGNVARDGASHQEIYDDYVDTTLVATITDVTSVADGLGGFDVTMTFTITKDGLPYVDIADLPTLEQKRFYITGYDSGTRAFNTATNFSLSSPTPTGTDGEYTVTKTGATYAPELTNTEAYLYLADGPLEAGSHYSLYADVANAGKAYGDAGSYVSTAAVSACERCHGAPYRKHGYRAAEVDNLGDFGACKVCHLDDKAGGHFAWQLLAEDPATYAEFAAIEAAGGDSIRDQISADATLAAQYAYNRTVMNDVHMSHAMEFPYPMSIANCLTCHPDLTNVTTDANFVAGTCKSCHPVNKTDDSEAQAPGIVNLWVADNLTATHAAVDWDNNDYNCAICHDGTTARDFATMHPGFNPQIYADATTAYKDEITVSIDSATLVGTDLTFDISASGTAGGLSGDDIEPDVMIGLYGYGTKDFIVQGHDRWDSNCNGVISRSDGDDPIGEFAVGSDDATCPNIYWTTVTNTPGAWTVTAHLATWSDQITAGIIDRVEIAVLPVLLDGNDEEVALNAPSRTFDLTANDFDDTFFEPIVDANKCNDCHDALATTFHSPDRGGNVTVCRMCHVGLAGGSHLELQSRSIDSYIHAIHSFQLFDIGDIDQDNPVDELQAELHEEHVFPNFTRLNCEACHVSPADTSDGETVVYSVPDQSKSMPGLLSASDEVDGREIGDIPSYVTGPASRACGGCHRVDFINDDDAGGLAAFLQHTKQNGYLIENDGETTLDTVIETIMSMFQ